MSVSTRLTLPCVQQHHGIVAAGRVVAGFPHDPRRHIARSSFKGNSSVGSSDASHDEDRIWSQLAFPSYLQSKNKHNPEVCRDFDKAVTAAERRQARDAWGMDASVEEDESEEDLEPETVWHTIRREAERDAAAEPLLSSFLYASILAHDTFERALAFVLSNRLANAVMLPTQLFEIFHEVLIGEPDVREGALADVEACRERDPACTSYSQALLYYKGYHAIQTHRIAHALWMRGQKVMAVALQSRMSEVLAVDIHPAARFGRGILLDHGTGVVIGETAVIGNNVSLLQNVTLGGTGKDHGDRHPKISNNVLIGACATVLGNIRVGEGAQIAAGSLVLKPVVPHTMVAGSPAKQVGTVTGNPAEKMQQWSKKLLTWDPFADPPPPQQAAAAAAPAPAQGMPKQQQSQQQQQQQQQQQLPPLFKPPQLPSNGKPVNGANGFAAKGAGSSSSSNGRAAATRAYIAAAEARWDAIAAQVTASDGAAAAAAPAGKKGGVQGSMHVHPAPTGSSSSSKDAAVQQASQQRQGSQAQQASSQAAAGAAVPLQQAAAAGQAGAAAAAGRKQASADVQGIHDGDVDATIDEEVAAKKWASRKEEPEYVI